MNENEKRDTNYWRTHFSALIFIGEVFIRFYRTTLRLSWTEIVTATYRAPNRIMAQKQSSDEKRMKRCGT